MRDARKMVVLTFIDRGVNTAFCSVLGCEELRRSVDVSSREVAWGEWAERARRVTALLARNTRMHWAKVSALLAQVTSCADL
jgi:crotonobetainyl-CoA:carnitine CoA-transferase CaiB-like acyl-CoA transferase